MNYEAQNKTSCLVLLGSSEALQVPGKLFEYLTAPRPSVFIKRDEKDRSLEFLEGLNRGIILNNSTEWTQR